MTLFLLLLVSCGPKAVPTANGTMADEFLTANRGLYIRASFDTDPSIYVGRFIKKGETDTSEASAMELSCSQYVTSRVVSAGGVTRDEYFFAASSAAASLGIPPALQVGAGGERGAMVRVRYTENLKMQFDISDAAGFEACCRKAPDQCTDRFVGEFIGGTGKVYYAVGSTSEFKGGAAGSTGVAELEAKDGRMWRASLEFPNDVYFAFRVADNVHVGGTDFASGRCDDPGLTWDTKPPESSQGRYFVGTSQLLPNEQAARDDALRDARVQATRAVSEGLTYEGGSKTEWSGTGSAMGSRSSGGSAVENSAGGTVSDSKDVAWCTENVERPTGGSDTRARVLLFVPGS